MTTRHWKAQSRYGWRTNAKVSRRKDCYEKQWLRGWWGDELGENTNIDESGEETDIDEQMAEISEVNAQQQAAEQVNWEEANTPRVYWTIIWTLLRRLRLECRQINVRAAWFNLRDFVCLLCCVVCLLKKMQIVLHSILFLSFLPLVLLLLSAHKHNSALCYSVKKLEKNQTQITHLGGAKPHADRSVLNRLCNTTFCKVPAKGRKIVKRGRERPS